MNLEFAIRSWSAWSPGLTEPEHWMAWAREPVQPSGVAQPELREMPSLLRRRLSPLGRAAAQVMYAQRAAGDGAGPVVLASRYGDAGRSLELLADLARGDPISPTSFGLSVHNAIGAMFSMACGDKANYSSVAAGAASAAAGLVEVAGLLADGAPEVLLVCYDAPLTPAYACFQTEAEVLYAWAWRVSLPQVGQPYWRLSCTGDGGAAGVAADAPGLPFALSLLGAVLAESPKWQRTVEGRRWELTRHA